MTDSTMPQTSLTVNFRMAYINLPARLLLHRTIAAESSSDMGQRRLET